MNSVSANWFPFPTTRSVPLSAAYRRALDFIALNEVKVLDPTGIMDHELERASDRGMVARLDVAEARDSQELITRGQGGYGYRAEYAAWRRLLKSVRVQGTALGPGLEHFPVLLAYRGPMFRYASRKEERFDLIAGDQAKGYVLGNTFWDRPDGSCTTYDLIPLISRDRVRKAHRLFEWTEAERQSKILKAVRSPILHAFAA